MLPSHALAGAGIGALLACVVLAVLSPREWHLLHRSMSKNGSTTLVVAASCVVGCAISYTGLWLQRLVTATSFMVLGSITKLLVVLWGIFFFGESHGPLSIIGAGLSVAGGYAYIRLR